MTYLTVWPQIFRGIGLMTAMIPINNVALAGLAVIIKRPPGLRPLDA